MGRRNPVVLAQRVRGANFGGFLAHARIEIAFVLALTEENARLFVAHAALHEHFVEAQKQLR
jgi:hypothetical protein